MDKVKLGMGFGIVVLGLGLGGVQKLQGQDAEERQGSLSGQAIGAWIMQEQQPSRENGKNLASAMEALAKSPEQTRIFTANALAVKEESSLNTVSIAQRARLIEQNDRIIALLEAAAKK